MKNIIRNLALGLSLSLPSLASAQGSYLADPTNTNNHAVVVAPGGNVGIGKLPIDSGYSKPLEIYSANNPGIRIQNPTTGTNVNDGLLIEQNGLDSLLVNYESGSIRMMTALSERVTINAIGKVGIGTTSPGMKLDVNVAARSNDGLAVSDSEGGWAKFSPSLESGAYNEIVQAGDAGIIFMKGSLNSGAFTIAPWASGLSGIRILANGNIGIGTATPTAKLQVNGTTSTKALELTGGSDIAEMFQSVEALEPGTVVVADEAHEGQVRAAATACDEAAIGIVSGAGGIQPAQTLRQEGTLADGNIPVSTGGRVYCKCDASFGAIKPGTLLTTSATPGHAMKVTDKARAQGAIIGKALTSLKEGQGLVLVWVTHQ